MAKSKFVKLGEKASIFFDPSSRLKVTPGQAVELSNDNKMSKRVQAALKSGHLEYALNGDDDEDLKKVTLDDLKKQEEKRNQASVKGSEKSSAGKEKAADNKAKAKAKQAEDEEEEEEEEEEWNEKSLKRLKKDELVTMAQENDSELSEEELNDLNKDKLVTEVLGLLEEE